MSVLHKRRLGNTRLEVSTLGFGGAPLGGFRSCSNDAVADSTVETAFENGITYFDTAPYYGYGRSEHRLGHILRRKRREQFVLSTKVGRHLLPLRRGENTSDLLDGGLSFRPAFDYTYEGVMRAYEQSVARLGVGRLDILLIHDVEPSTHGSEAAAEERYRECMAGAIPALEELRKAGDISAFGVGMNQTDWCQRFVESTDLDCAMIAGRYTLLDQQALDGLLPACERRGVSLIVGGPFNSGILATGPKAGALFHYQNADQGVLNKTCEIQAVCEANGVPLQAAALQFALGHPAIASVVAGSSTPENVEGNIANMTAAIPARLWDDLKSEKLVDARCPMLQSTH
ncbi:aldo/keto reductase [Nitratireductor sp. XY-223]|uniref:aldo/keto reductase n=1 Tax=Nitratireductor sp. XY-223 TaxID=2561926 RepID=UPI0010AAC0C0|nr:aldo/keto reductase [Nitratireductor sp. XY-223]